MLGLRLIVCNRNPFPNVLRLFNFFENYDKSKSLGLISLLRSWIISLSLGVFVLPIISFILVGRDFYRLHSQLAFIFLGFLSYYKVLIVCLD